MNEICPKCRRPIQKNQVCPFCGSAPKKDTDILKALFITLAIIACIALFGYFSLQWIGNPLRFVQEHFISSPLSLYKITKASPNLPISRAPVESINIADIAKLHELLKNKQFETLNTILAGYQEAYQTDCKNEFRVYDAFRAFGLSDPSNEELFNQWITATPDVFYPYLASAEFYYKQAWDSRGSAYAAETSKSQFEGMNLNFKKAEKHIDTALKMNPNLLRAYFLLLGIRNASGNEEDEDRIFDQAIKFCPDSVLIRHQYLWCKLPRWGGSYEIMENCAKNSEAFAQNNPRLSTLYGRIYEDQANLLKKQKQYQQALALLDKGIAFGDHMNFYLERADLYHFYLRDEDKALENADRCVWLRPVFMDGYLLRARIFYAKNEIPKSLEDLQTAMILSPGDPKISEWRTWAVKDLLYKGHKVYKTDLPAAIQYYDTAIMFDDRAVEPFYWRGMANVTLKNSDSALADFKKAVENDPHYFEAYRMIDYLLYQNRDWDAIIGYWDAFLAVEPKHAAAYLERAGTYRHKGDMENAIKDLKQSCDLGNQEACKRYATIKN